MSHEKNNSWGAPVHRSDTTKSQRGPNPSELPSKGGSDGSSSQVGDVNSDAIGSGARYNSGKPDFSLVILKHLPLPEGVATGEHGLLYDAFQLLANFQLDGKRQHLQDALQKCYEYGGKFKGGDTKFIFEPVVGLWGFGKEKYAQWNWAKGMPWSVPIGCGTRHFLAVVECGDIIDEDSGQPHWAAFVCNLQMLLLYTYTYTQGNDLPYNAWQG